MILLLAHHEAVTAKAIMLFLQNPVVISGAVSAALFAWRFGRLTVADDTTTEDDRH